MIWANCLIFFFVLHVDGQDIFKENGKVDWDAVKNAKAIVGQNGQTMTVKDIKMHMFSPFYSSPNTHSWFLAIEQNGNRAKCGASLMRQNEYLEESKIVLTAAQCVYNQTSKKMFKNMKVVAAKRRYDGYNPTEQYRDIVEIISHPDFRQTSDGDTFNDLAVVKLNEPIKFQKNLIEPIELADHVYEGIIYDCILAGWGYSKCEQQILPAKLQQMWARVLPKDDCKITYPNFDHKTTICYDDADKGGAAPTLGDTGGPVVCAVENKGFLQVGVIIANKADCPLAKESIGVNVGNYYDWIMDSMHQLLGMK